MPASGWRASSAGGKYSIFPRPGGPCISDGASPSPYDLPRGRNDHARVLRLASNTGSRCRYSRPTYPLFRRSHSRRWSWRGAVTRRPRARARSIAPRGPSSMYRVGPPLRLGVRPGSLIWLPLFSIWLAVLVTCRLPIENHFRDLPSAIRSRNHQFSTFLRFCWPSTAVWPITSVLPRSARPAPHRRAV
jgi:hypothetical protein